MMVFKLLNLRSYPERSRSQANEKRCRHPSIPLIPHICAGMFVVNVRCMIRNYFLITFRGLMKNKVFITINVFGMGIAIACCIVAYLAYQYDATFDGVHQNRESIYRVSAVREFENKETRFGFAPLPLGEVVDKTFQDVDRSTRYLSSWSNFKREDAL